MTSKYSPHRTVKLIPLWLLTHHICDNTRRDSWIAFHPPFSDEEWRKDLGSQKCRKCTYILVVKWRSWMPWKDRRLTVLMFVRIAYLKEIKEETFIMIDHCISTVLIWWYHKCICNWKFSPKQKFNILEGGQHQSQSNEKHFKLEKRRRRIDLRESAKMHIACYFCSSLMHLLVGDFDTNNYQWDRPFYNE